MPDHSKSRETWGSKARTLGVRAIFSHVRERRLEADSKDQVLEIGYRARNSGSTDPAIF